MAGERKVGISHDANDNVIITGDGNLVIVQTTRSLEIAGEPHAPNIGTNPYRGLEVFREEHADRFFGRESLTDKLWTIFHDLHQMPISGPASSRLLPIVGASGSGKSSLARAGLIAELARRPLPGRSEARVGVITPGSHPIESLALVLARIATEDQTPVRKTTEFAQRLHSPGESGKFDGLRFVADLLPEIAAKPLILLVDQFEEIYSLCDDAAERDAFIGNLLYAAGATPARVSIVATLRSDFLGATNRHPMLSHAIAERGMLVPAMSEEELRRTIEQPALDAGHPIDPASVELLVADTAGREGALPLLQFALTRIWDGMANGIVPAQTLRDLGGVGGALAKEAEQLYDSLSENDKRIARRAFLAMVRLGEGTLDTRRRAAVPELVGQGEDPDRVMNVLRIFSQPDKRLVTLSARADGVSTAEVTHEALLDDWSLLREWLAVSRDDVRFHRRLAEAAEHWDKQDRPHGLLWRPPDLDLLRKFHLRAGTDMTSTQTAFFAASKQQYQRTRTLRQAVIMVLAVLTIAAVGFGTYAEYQRRVAEEARREAVDARVDAEIMRDLAEKAVDRARREQIRADGEAERAIAERDRALVTQSLFLAELSRQETATGNATNGILLALEGLPSDVTDPNRPYVIETEAALRSAVLQQRERLILSGHNKYIRSAAFSPDGRFVVTASGDNTARVWDASNGKGIVVLRGHEMAVTSAVFSPNGERVVTASEDRTARVWDAATGRNLAVMRGHIEGVTSAAFSLDGKRVLTASWDTTARLWDAENGRHLVMFTGHRGSLRIAAFSPDGQLVATASDDNAAALWDFRSGQMIRMLSGHEGWVISAAFSPNGQRLATGSVDGTAHVWQVGGSDVEQTPVVLRGHRAQVLSVAFSPDDDRVVTASADHTARLWNATNGNSLVELVGHESSVESATFSPDGNTVLTASGDKTARLWRASSGEMIAVLGGHEGGITSAVFSPTEQLVATASDDGTARLWDAASPRSAVTLNGSGAAVTSAAISPDGERVITTSDDNAAYLWDSRSGRKIADLSSHLGPVTSAEFSPDGKRLITASDPSDVVTCSGETQPWRTSGRISYLPNDLPEECFYLGPRSGSGYLANSTTGKKLAVLGNGLSGIRSVAFSSDGKYVVAASDYHAAYLWDATNGSGVDVLRGHLGAVTFVVFSPDVVRVVTTSRDATARLWELSSGSTMAVLSGHTGTVLSAAFSPDGKRLVTASEDGTARIWDATNGRIQIVLQSLDSPLSGAAFSPDGQRIITVSAGKSAQLWDATSGRSIAVLSHDGGIFRAIFSPNGSSVMTWGDHTVRLWETVTGTNQAILRGHDGQVVSAVFSPNGQHILTAGSDGTARLWEAASGKELIVLRGHQAGLVAAVFSPDGRHILTASMDGIAHLWPAFLSAHELLVHAKSIVPRQLTTKQREQFFISSDAAGRNEE